MSRRISAPLLGLLILLMVVLATIWIYSATQVHNGKKLGIYNTPEECMYALVAKDYHGIKRIEIARMNREVFDHLRFIKVYIYADRRADGLPVAERGYDEESRFFVKTKSGWTFVEKNKLPKIIALGQWLFGRLS
jgi:hypothetical protein